MNNIYIDQATGLLHWQQKSMKIDGWMFFSAFCRCLHGPPQIK